MLVEMKQPSGGGGGSTLYTYTITNSATTDTFFGSNFTYSIDVKTLLPGVYKNLTLDNFSIADNVLPMNGTSALSGGQNTVFNSYNATTGVLSTNKRYQTQTISGTPYYKYVKYHVKVTYVG